MNEFLGVPYPIAESMTSLDTLIDEKIHHLIKNVFNGNVTAPLGNSRNVKSGQIKIQLYELRVKKSKKTGWFGQVKSEDEEKRLWESWVINVKCYPVDEGGPGNVETGGKLTDDRSSTKSEPMAMSIASFKENLNNIIDIADTHKDHIPPITSLDSLPFPYTIIVSDTQVHSTATEEESWGTLIKKMLD